MSANAQEIDHRPGLAKVLAFEDELAKLPQIEAKLDHLFSGGMYARTIYLPAGTLITGKVHKQDGIDVLMKGSMRVMSDDGTLKIVTAPMVMASKKGVKRAGLALTDVEWVSTHTTHTTTPEAAEDELVEEGRPHILALLNQEAKGEIT